MTSADTPTEALEDHVHTRHQELGPRLWISAAAVALVITVLAGSVAKDLGQHGRAGYQVSGAFMTLADILLLLGVVAFAWAGVVPRGGWRGVAGWLAIVGSAGSVGAEIALRVNFDAGSAAFGVAGSAQALGFIGLGIAVVLERRWSSWHRFALLALGLYVPCVLVPALASSGGQNLAALACFHFLVLAVGIAWARELKSSTTS